MLYEIRTYTFKPRSLPEVLDRFAEAYEQRQQLSRLAAFWTTEIGPLNQTVQVWPYADLNERARIRDEAMKLPAWPPKNSHLNLRMETEVFVPFDSAPPFPAGVQGPVFELRSYQLAPGGGVASVAADLAQYLPRRVQASPLLFAGYTELGALNKFVHIWPYASHSERTHIRAQVVADGIWPPPAAPLVSQENKILVAAPFSPLQ